MGDVHVFISTDLTQSTNSFIRRVLHSMYPDDYIDIGKNIFGKKYLCFPHQDINISITHNEEFLAVAISKLDIGIDIENLHSTISKADLEYIFSNDNQLLINNINQNKLIQVWTGVEAFLKCYGLGFLLGTEYFVISRDLSFISLKNISKIFHISYISLPFDNNMAICSTSELDTTKISFM